MAFSNPVVGGEGGELIRDSIKSPNFVTTVSGWIIRRDGSAEFNTVVIRGAAIIGGSLTVGDAGSPQVVIHTTGTDGIIEFPTNRPIEDAVAFLRSEVQALGAANESLSLRMRSPSVNGSGEYAQIDMSSAADDGSADQKITLELFGISGLQQQEILATETNYFNAIHNFDNEVYVAEANADANYPTRVVAGLIGTGTTNTTINTGSVTAITNASGSVHLVQGAAYRMEVTVPLSATATSSAAGTQRVTWSIWQGTVGSGTRLGGLSRKFKCGAVGSMQEDVNFWVIFKHTSSTGSYTLNLGAQHTQGTDTLQATYSDNFNMLLTRIGDPDVIVNL